MVGGVASGLALHLGIEVWVVRVAFVLLAVTGGAGVAMYAAFWALVPLAPAGEPFPDAAPAPRSGDPASREGGPARTTGGTGDEASDRLGPLLALGAVALGGILVAQQLGLGPSGPVAVPLLVVGLGVAVLWRVADDAAARAPGGGPPPERPPGGGLGARRDRAWCSSSSAPPPCSGRAAVCRRRWTGWPARSSWSPGVALVAGPVVVRIARDLRDERRARIRVAGARRARRARARLGRCRR